MQQAGVDNPRTENVARGFTSSQAVVRAWLRDRQDRRNIDDCDAQLVGVSVVVSDNGTPFWTADFAG
jgi:uncharacterized protein YkwD